MAAGTFSISNGPTYNFISNGPKVSVSASANGTLQGSTILDATTQSAKLYSGDGVGDYNASANLELSKSMATLKYSVEYFSQQGTSTINGILGSWTLDD